MIKLQAFLTRREDMSHNEFRQYWLENHVPLAKQLSGLLRYRTAVPIVPDRTRYDGIAELYFDSVEDYSAVLGPEAHNEAIDDVANFEAASDRHLVNETVHLNDLEGSTRNDKVVAVLQRSTDLTQSEFRTRLDQLAPPITPDQGLRKFTTAHPLASDRGDYDGIAEVYVDDVDTLTRALEYEFGTSTWSPWDESVVERTTSIAVTEIVQLDDTA